MIAILSISIFTLSVSALAAVWWGSRRISKLGEEVSRANREAASAKLELATGTVVRDRALFELSATAENANAQKARIHALEDTLADLLSEISSSGGLAVDDVVGRLQRRENAYRAGHDPATGDPIYPRAVVGPLYPMATTEGATTDRQVP